MYQLTILTLEKTIFSDQVRSLIARGDLGYLEILSHHAPIITLLMPGKLEITTINSNKIHYYVSGGFLEVSNNEATVFADAIEVNTETPVEGY